jgi:hypothetical protein
MVCSSTKFPSRPVIIKSSSSEFLRDCGVVCVCFAPLFLCVSHVALTPPLLFTRCRDRSFAEIFHNTAGSRKFGLVVEDQVIPEFDIIFLAGASFTATRREIPTLVKDGFLSIKAAKFVEHPKISAIEIKSVGAHLAHSVPGRFRDKLYRVVIGNA